MKYLSKLYGKAFIEEFYVPCFMNFIQTQIEGDKLEYLGKM
jgi:hypothetical protein